LNGLEAKLPTDTQEMEQIAAAPGGKGPEVTRTRRTLARMMGNGPLTGFQSLTFSGFFLAGGDMILASSSEAIRLNLRVASFTLMGFSARSPSAEGVPLVSAFSGFSLELESVEASEEKEKRGMFSLFSVTSMELEREAGCSG